MMSLAAIQADELPSKPDMPRFARWVSPFLKLLPEKPSPVTSVRRVPDGMGVYCIGDVHGRDDLLEQMAACLKADKENRSFDEVVTVFLGDYVDRGLGSKQVLERLSTNDWPTAVIALAGNHEDLLLHFLEDEKVFPAWRSLGGLETLHSYGVDVGAGLAGRDHKKIQQAFLARFPQHHREFLNGLPISKSIGDYFFCHAGIRPGVPLDHQKREDLLTIRDPFLLTDGEHGKLIVHGHTPSLHPDIRDNRIGIDTAAYATNRLTCLVLEKDERRFLYAGAGAAGDKQ
ncbi:MAG TPA: metallophosphoesterase family protein [Nitrospira sp.]|nr:metallophosphoesterase family protein [Nitrospira sp.]